MTRKRKIIIAIIIASFISLAILLRIQSNKDKMKYSITDPVTKKEYSFTGKYIRGSEWVYTYRIPQKVFENYFESEGYKKGTDVEFDGIILSFKIDGEAKTTIMSHQTPIFYREKNSPALVYYKKEGDLKHYQLYEIKTKTAYSVEKH